MEKEKIQTMTIRVPKSLHTQIQLAAYKDNRTINSWMVNLIKQTLSVKK